MSTKIFTLDFPFEYKGTKYDSFEARRPKVRDVRKFIKNLDGDAVLAMEKSLADLIEVDENVIAEIDIADFGPMKAWFEDFLKPMATGSTD